MLATIRTDGLRLACPRCRTELNEAACPRCSFALQEENEIVRALPPEREAFYARFTEEYARIRAAEGRSSRNDDFYLALPFADLTGRNAEQWRIRSRSFVCMTRTALRQLRASALVLDVGAGNGWMSYR